MRAERQRVVCFDLRSLEGSLDSYAGRPHQNLCPSSVALPRLGTPDPPQQGLRPRIYDCSGFCQSYGSVLIEEGIGTGFREGF